MPIWILVPLLLSIVPGIWLASRVLFGEAQRLIPFLETLPSWLGNWFDFVAEYGLPPEIYIETRDLGLGFLVSPESIPAWLDLAVLVSPLLVAITAIQFLMATLSKYPLRPLPWYMLLLLSGALLAQS